MRERDAALATVLITGWELPTSDARISEFDFRLIKPVEMDLLMDVVTRAIALHDQRSASDTRI